jgi:hypothetical protein
MGSFHSSATISIEFFHANKGNSAMDQQQRFSTYQSYLKDRKCRIKRTVSAIEKRGVEAALDRSRMLTAQISRDLRDVEFEHLGNNISSLAGFQVSIERAAFLLGRIPVPNSARTQSPFQRSTRSAA